MLPPARAEESDRPIMPEFSVFVESSIPEQKQLSNGNVFPAVLVPAAAPGKRGQLAAALKQGSRFMLQDCLNKSGAVLIRGFGLEHASDFNDFVQALECEEFPYSVGGEASRNRVTGSVFTANDGVPIDKPIGFHNEVAYLPNSPSKIIFFCQTPAPRGAGGSTLIAHGRSVYEKLIENDHEQFLKELECKGVRYSKRLAEDGHGSWKSMFQTHDKADAEERARRVGSSLEWLADGGAMFHSNPCPGVKVDPATGNKLWFNTIHGIQIYKANSPPGSFDAMFGDGSPFPAEALKACTRILEEEQVAFVWQKGDILVVDNNSVLHARQPSQSPRTILVSLCR